MDRFIKVHKKFNKHIPEDKIWTFLLQCLEALSYIHSLGVIHRDIMSANILMDNNMSIKLGDFGISALQNNVEDNKYLNVNFIFKNFDIMKYHGINLGTPLYIAKEIEMNEYDQKIDVYAMDLSFFEMCYLFNPNDPYEKNKEINIIN